ncbi:MAG: hypothetical protein ACM32O_02045 [Clostridia bacterium]
MSKKVTSLALIAAISVSTIPLSSFAAGNLTPSNANVAQASETIIQNQFENLNLPVETSQKIAKMMESKEAKLLFDGLDNYQEYYTVDDNGYSFTKGAEENIPEEIYILLEDTFKQANEFIEKKKNREKINNPQKLKSSGAVVFAPDPGTGGTTITGKDTKTYYYQGPNWSVGDWLYVSDSDTRDIVEVLIYTSAITTVTAIVLGLFRAALPSASSYICALIAGTAAGVISNRNLGKGVIFRVYSGGSAIYSR